MSRRYWLSAINLVCRVVSVPTFAVHKSFFFRSSRPRLQKLPSRNLLQQGRAEQHHRVHSLRRREVLQRHCADQSHGRMQSGTLLPVGRGHAQPGVQRIHLRHRIDIRPIRGPLPEWHLLRGGE